MEKIETRLHDLEYAATALDRDEMPPLKESANATAIQVEKMDWDIVDIKDRLLQIERRLEVLEQRK